MLKVPDRAPEASAHGVTVVPEDPRVLLGAVLVHANGQGQFYSLTCEYAKRGAAVYNG